MKLLVAVKQVATLDEEFEIRADGKDVEAGFLVRDLNEWDEYSLEQAVRIREVATTAIEVVAVCVGPDEADEALRKCLGKGADRAIRVWDDALSGSDSIAIARVIAAVARREKPDMLFAGVQSSDHAFASTGIACAALLDWPHAAVLNQLDWTPTTAKAIFRRELEGGVQHEMQIDCPAVLTIQVGINAPRYASLRAIKLAMTKPIEGMTPEQLGMPPGNLGEAGSASRVRRMYAPEKARAQMIEGSVEQQAARIAQLIKEHRGGAA
jgi:electron transfer flavoprotein beta subunit